MKYKLGDRVKCFSNSGSGYGEVIDVIKANKLVPITLYRIKLDKPVFNKSFLWYGEHQIQFEKDIRWLDDYKNSKQKDCKKNIKRKERGLSL